jgi:short-subunit dehydrogenase
LNYFTTLSGKKALVTGASSGIGKSVALALLKSGVDVALVSRSASEALALELTHGLSATATAYALDLADLPSVAAKISAIVNDFSNKSGIDILINSAGMGYVGEIIDTPLADWQHTLDLNLTSVFQCIQSVLPAMRSQRSGTIINVASIAAKQAFPGWGAYSASKFALLGLTQALAAEERSHGIKVMAICPGSVDTPLWDTLPTEVAANFDRQTMLSADSVAECIMTMLTLPSNAVVSDLVLMPNAGIL